MVPFSDNIPAQRTPVVTYLLIAIHVGCFVYQSSLPPSDQLALFYRWGLLPCSFEHIGEGPRRIPVDSPVREHLSRGPVTRIERREFPVEGTAIAALLPMFTSMFLHGGLLHLVGNLWYLWIFGDNVEDRLGHARFFAMYLMNGIAASGAHVWASWGSRVPTIGASGAVAGVLGAYFVTYPYARVRAWMPFLFYLGPVIEVPAVLFLGLWFFIQFRHGTQQLVAMPDQGGVAWWAHIGGFVCGIIFLELFAPVPKGRRRATST